MLLGQSAGDSTNTYTTDLLPGEYWWGGFSVDGSRMPYTVDTDLSREQYGDGAGNQSQPLLLSSRGRYVWSEEPMHYAWTGGHLEVSVRTGKLITGQAGDNLRSAFEYASENFFPPSGELPDTLLFTRPQYNTWIELTYDQEQEAILRYARAIIDEGYPPGVLMIDDNWQEDYGDWTFSGKRFPDPHGMMDSLHAMGFRVMLWVCPFVSPDSDEYRYLRDEGLLIGDGTLDPVQPALIRWWNGGSGVLDLSNPEAQDWFHQQLAALVEDYGVDGFKLDAGDSEFYTGDLVTHLPGTPNDQTTRFAEIGLEYPLNEYRASWKMAGQPLVQRLRDKDHSWEALQMLIPGILAQGMMGYAFVCPDMIGGGQFTSFLDGAPIDQELVVRSAQVHALMPMMQFSVAPWRVLDAKHNAYCLEMAELHSRFGSRILELARVSSVTGVPIARPLAFEFPGAGYEAITDQFMLGPDLLIAPVVEQGQRRRGVTFPAGRWRGDDGTVVTGPVRIDIDVPLERLPYFERLTAD